MATISHAQNPSILRVARDFYATYCASSGGKNYQGLPCPAWDALTESVRGHWYTVAKRALSPGALADYEALPGGMMRSLPPGAEALDHLPDPAAALATWHEYTGA